MQDETELSDHITPTPQETYDNQKLDGTEDELRFGQPNTEARMLQHLWNGFRVLESRLEELQRKVDGELEISDLTAFDIRQTALQTAMENATSLTTPYAIVIAAQVFEHFLKTGKTLISDFPAMPTPKGRPGRKVGFSPGKKKAAKPGPKKKTAKKVAKKY